MLEAPHACLVGQFARRRGERVGALKAMGRVSAFVAVPVAATQDEVGSGDAVHHGVALVEVRLACQAGLGDRPRGRWNIRRDKVEVVTTEPQSDTKPSCGGRCCLCLASAGAPELQQPG